MYNHNNIIYAKYLFACKIFVLEIEPIVVIDDVVLFSLTLRFSVSRENWQDHSKLHTFQLRAHTYVNRAYSQFNMQFRKPFALESHPQNPNPSEFKRQRNIVITDLVAF